MRARLGQTRRMVIGLVGVAAISVAATVGPTFAQSAPAAASSREQDDRAAALCAGRAEPKGVAAFFRTELYFGSNKPDGTAVTPAEFQRFLDQEITPRFPDGLTLLTGLGQFRGSSGVVEHERSMLLILLYPTDTARDSGRKIEEIRAAYEHQFQQESVLRADEPRAECVSF